MWNIGKLIIKNLLTHKETEYVFEKDKAVMFSGINLDDLSTASNGSGKSTIGDGVCLAITGDSLRQVRAVELVRNGEKFLEVELWLHNSQTNDILWIYRKIFANSNSNQLKILFNSELPKGVAESSGAEGCVDIKAGKAFILQTIGVAEDDFFNYFVLSKDTYQPFLLSTDATMKKVIDRFSNSKIIEPVFGQLKIDIAEKDSEITKIEKNKVREETKIEGFQEELEKIKETDEESLKTQLIQNLEGDIEHENGQILNLRDKISSTAVSISLINQSIDDVKIDIETVEKSIKKEEKKTARLTDIKQEFENTLAEAEVEITKIKNQIAKKQEQEEQFDDLKSDLIKKIQGVIDCPKCSHEFILADKEFDVEQGREDLKDIKGVIEKMQATITSYKAKIVELKNNNADTEQNLKDVKEDIKTVENNITVIKKTIRDKKSIISNFEQDIKNHETSINSNKKTIESCKQRITLTEQRISQEREREIIDRTEEIEEKIRVCRDNIELLDKAIGILILEKQNLVEQELKFKKFKTYLANQCIGSIEGYTNFYLKKMHTNLQVKISGYRELANGSLKEEISCSILRDGFDEGNIKKFSGGEKGKVILANILALQKIINLNSESGGLNFTWLDEILESIDYVGIVAVYEAANQLKQSINIISHVKDFGFENEVFIRKQDKVSRIIDKMEFTQSILKLV